MNKAESVARARVRRRHRVRGRIFGTAARPRLSVYKSNTSVYAQLIDDVQGRTIIAVGTNDKELRGASVEQSKTASAKAVGLLLAKRAVDAGLGSVVFDRGYSPYHGRVKALAEGSREGGLQF